MDESSKKSIFVTGASSGIGMAVAFRLARDGYVVLASVRKEKDISNLTIPGLANLKPVFPLDLTKPEQIHLIARNITAQIKNNELPKLYGIINVAGGGQIAPVELMNIQGFRDELETRLVGPVTLLQQFLPLLRQSRGRILWIATPGLFPVPYVTDIHAPDFAVNYLARTLNLELRPDGIKNILIRCGGIDTSSPERTEKVMRAMFNKWPKEKLDIYRERLIKLQESHKKFNTGRTAPEVVATLISKVLLEKNPKTRYSIGYMAAMGAFLERLPQSWIDYIMGKRES